MQTTATTPETTSRNEIVYIDGRVKDIPTLLQAIRPGAEVHVLDATRDGLAQINEALAGRTGIDAIHLIGHGSSGSTLLGSTTLSAATLQSNSAALSVLGQSLTTEGDVLLYGCDVAQGETGQAFVQELARLTGADVAASTDITGNSGDWTLEYSAGDIETHGAFNYASLDAYQHDLTVNGWDRGAATYYMQVDATGNIGVGFSGGMWTVTNDGNLLGGNWEMVRWTFTAYYTPLGGSMSLLYGTGTYYYWPGYAATQQVSGGGVGSFWATQGSTFYAAPGSQIQIASLQAVNDRTGGPSLYLDQSVGLSDYVPRFVDASSNTVTAQTITVPVNATNFNLRPYLMAADANTQNLTWNVYQQGSHGTATVSGSTTVVGVGALPTASGTYTYTPVANYSGQDTIKISVNDGIATVVKTFTINMNDPPVVKAADGTTAYTPGATAYTESTPVVIRTDISISDTAETEWDGGKLTVAVTTNAEATDRLTLPTSNGGGIWLDTSGNKLMSGSTQIGSADAARGTGSTAWTLTFNSSATHALVTATAQAVMFDDATDAPGNSNRTITITAIDKNGGDGTTVTQTITVTPVNDAPSGGTPTKTATEDTDYTFASADFGFTDPDLTTGSNNTLQAVEITTLPANGSIKLNGSAVSQGQSISVADITLNKLIWTPGANSYGMGLSNFTFKVSDGALLDTTARTFTFDVTAIADTPNVTNAQTRPITQSTSGLVISRNAADSTEVTHFKITGITGGTLYQSDGLTAIADNDFITFAQANLGLKFTPTSGTITGHITVQASMSASDGGLGGNTVTADILVNIPPTSTNDSATTLEDTTIVLASTDFGAYTDTDSPPDPFTSVKVSTLPLTGSLQYDATGSGNWAPVTLNQVITVPHIDASRLRFTPGTD